MKAQGRKVALGWFARLRRSTDNGDPLPGLTSRLAEPFRYPIRELDPADVAKVEAMLSGSFSPAALFPAQPIGVPPPWQNNPTGNRSWDFHRHSWEWMEPLIRACEDDAAFLLTKQVVTSWLEAESERSNSTGFWWHDHAAAIRGRVIAFMWEAFARLGRLDSDTGRLLLACVEMHGKFLVDDSNYAFGSNHGLEMDVSLIVLGRMFPELEGAAEWVAVGERRMGAYVADNFSRAGIHLEQSPAYHSFVFIRLVSVLKFYVANGFAPPHALSETIDRAASMWYHLIRSDGSIPPMGDSPEYPKPSSWERRFRELTGREPPPPAPGIRPNPRSDGSEMVVDEEAGYAIFTNEAGWGFHLTLRVAAFESLHRHFDALGFVARAFGRDWITDSGYHGYENGPERRYVVSSRAHNVVLIDDGDFSTHPVSVLELYRRNDVDGIMVEHALPEAVHTRTLDVDHAAMTVSIHDRLSSVDGTSHDYIQLLHLHPDIEVVDVGAAHVELRSPENNRLVVRQEGACRIELLNGTSPAGRLDGWYSADYHQWRPNSVIRCTPMDPVADHEFRTRFEFSEP